MTNHRLALVFGATFITVSLSHSLESTLTLPKGISRVRNVSVFTTSVNDKLDSTGRARGLADPLNQSVSAGEIIKAGLASDPNNSSYQQLKALYEGLNSISPDQNLGEFFQVRLSGDSSIKVQRYFVGYEYGIFDDLSVGLSVPVLNFDVSASAQANMVSNTAQIKAKIDQVKKYKKLSNSLDSVEAQKANIEEAVLNAAFDAKGYQRPHNFSYTALGEVELGIKKNWLRSKNHGISTQFGLRLPTASRSKDFSNVFDPGAGDNQSDIYSLLVYDLIPSKHLRIGNSIKYTAQLPDREYMPIRRRGETGLADLNDPYVWDNANRNLGDSFDYELVTSYNFWRQRFSATALYNFHYKNADSITGSKSLDYANISNNTEVNYHSYELGLSFSSVNDVLSSGNGIPVVLRVAYNDTLTGKNTFDASYYRLDFELYFK